MQQSITLKLTPEEAASEERIIAAISKKSGHPQKNIKGYTILKKSMDARSRQIWFNIEILIYINEPKQQERGPVFHFKQVNQAKDQVIIVGAGPAGLFAALQLIEKGIKPIIIERGKDVRTRRRDLAAINKSGIINPESNYCFGEGGAGTYSDGKLYTRSKKRGDVQRILQLFVYFGAEENILYEAHPHIGTNKLPKIIVRMREHIIACGGELHFNKKLKDIIVEKGDITAIITEDGETMKAAAVILATGHSARDIFHLLEKKNIAIEAKPFALGVRAEHPQQLIDQIQYKCSSQRGPYLPPASYSLVQQVDQLGVFSFCMCPGGIIAPAATAINEIVVNGWSPSKRNNEHANSGIVVQVQEKDVLNYKPFVQQYKQYLDSPLLMLYFQQFVEQKAFMAGGGNLVAPAQRMVDFSAGKISADLPTCSYLPGIISADLKAVLPDFILHSLQKGFRLFGQKMHSYFTNDAVVVATESRTSSPVRIPRDASTLQHPQVKRLFPCGEGAGYAGGIVSAAMDGERVANVIAEMFI